MNFPLFQFLIKKINWKPPEDDELFQIVSKWLNKDRFIFDLVSSENLKEKIKGIFQNIINGDNTIYRPKLKSLLILISNKEKIVSEEDYPSVVWPLFGHKYKIYEYSFKSIYHSYKKYFDKMDDFKFELSKIILKHLENSPTSE